MSGLRNLWQKIREEPFIASTGAAAFVHSTWSLSVIFSGSPPDVTDWRSFIQAAFIVVPAALIAFSVDVGQIATSSEIRNGNTARSKYVTFAVLALTTYYLQWLYLAHHLPSLALGEGIRSEWAFVVTIVRDASIWVLPALLPMATVLYTTSHTRDGHRSDETVTQHPKISIETPTETPAIEPTKTLELEPVIVMDTEGKAPKPARLGAGLAPAIGVTLAKKQSQNGNGHSNGNGNGHNHR